jgi:hypothetical protein
MEGVDIHWNGAGTNPGGRNEPGGSWWACSRRFPASSASCVSSSVMVSRGNLLGGTDLLPYLPGRDRLLHHTYAEGKMIHWKGVGRAIASIREYRCPPKPGIAEGRYKRVPLRNGSGSWDEDKKNP